MRFIVKLGFIVPMIFTTSLNAQTPKITIYMDQCCGPFTGESDFEIYLYDSKKGANYSCTLSHYYVDSGNKYASTSCQVGTKSNGVSTPLTIVAEGRMEHSGIKLHFDFGNGRTFETNMKRPEHSSINAARYKESDVVINNRIIYFGDNRLNTSEKMSFKNTNDYISTNKNNAMDFSELSFVHSSYIGLNYTKAFLRIYDYENVYPKFSSGTSLTIIELPLALSKNDGVITFECKTKLYVKMSTLEMYPKKASGTVQTTEFYVPIGREEKMSSNELEIIIENFGADQSIITIPLEFYDYRSLFGLCHNADYCVEGGIVQ